MSNDPKKIDEIRQNEAAPYRFIPLNKVVARSPVGGEALNAGVPQKGHLDARITVDWLAETPFLIGEDKINRVIGPFQLGRNGPYAIPGASIKGMLRSVMEIICYGRLTQINGHHRYGYRDFNHNDYRGRMTNNDNIRAGWLVEEVDKRTATKKWFIEEASWYKLTIDSICAKYGARYDVWPTMNLIDKYRRLGRKEGPDRKPVIDFNKTDKYRLETVKGRPVAVLDDKAEKTGVVVCSGGIPEPKKHDPRRRFQKKYEYIFEVKDDAKKKKIELVPKVFNTFVLNHSKPGKNKRTPEGSWKDLKATLEKTGRIPVFFSGDLNNQNDDFYFGLTRLFKIPYKYSVDEILTRDTAHTRWPGEKTPDIVEGLFGFVYEDNEKPENADRAAQRGRVAFGFATCNNPSVRMTKHPQEVVMMGPRPSFSPYYLAGKRLDYNDEQVHLAGRKRYPVRYPQNSLGSAPDEIESNLRRTLKKGQSKELKSKLQYLLPSREPSEELLFQGEIRLKNIHPVELGALLWAITFGDVSPQRIFRHSLGRGKAFGMGQIHAREVHLTTDRYDGKKDTGQQRGIMEHYLEVFKGYMRQYYKDWPLYLQNDQFNRVSNPEVGELMQQQGKLSYPGDYKAYKKIKSDRQMEENTPMGNSLHFPQRLLSILKK